MAFVRQALVLEREQHAPGERAPAAPINVDCHRRDCNDMPQAPKMSRMREPLVETDEIAARLGDPSIRLIDCRFDLAHPGWGEAAYREAHIGGAVYAHLDRDLSSAVTPTSGRHPLPDPEHLAQTFSRWGIDSSRDVVAYDQDTGA